MADLLTLLRQHVADLEVKEREARQTSAKLYATILRDENPTAKIVAELHVVMGELGLSERDLIRDLEWVGQAAALDSAIISREKERNLEKRINTIRAKAEPELSKRCEPRSALAQEFSTACQALHNSTCARQKLSELKSGRPLAFGNFT